jgi:hypothetical protein
MSLRSLWTVALIVWAVAAVVGVLFGLPLLFTIVGFHVDAGLIVNALVAVGTFGAAAAAVWVAISGRRQLKDERDAADHAQARLVLVEVAHLPAETDIKVTVKNYGDRPILDVTYESVEVEGFPSAQFIRRLRWENVIKPNRDDPNGAVFQVRAADEPTQKILQSIPIDTPLAATVCFTDANGKRWQTTFELRRQQATEGGGSLITSPSWMPRRGSPKRV